jgi:uncharacterized protein YjdB
MPFTFKLSQRLARSRAQNAAASALALAIAAVVACELPTRPPVGESAAYTVAVSPKTLTLQQFQAVDFTAVGLTSVGDTAAMAVSWSVSSGSIVDTSTTSGRHRGRYRAGSDTGKVKVIAKGNPGGPSDTAVVTVTPATVVSVVVSPPTAGVTVGQTVQLAATPSDVDGNALSGRVVTWASTNPGVATVNGSGLVSGVAAGAATLTAACEGQSGTAALTVTVVPVAAIAVSPATASVTAGQTVQLTATPKDANGNPLTGRTVTWGTSNAAVAAVSGSGLVTGGAAGSATITASSEGKNGTAALTVTPVPVASVTVSPAAPSVLVGQTVQLAATLKDANGNALTGRVVTWATSNAGVATVSGSGLVTSVTAGTATLTATSEGKSGTAALTVSTVPVATVTVTPASASLLVGGTAQLTATMRDSAGGLLTGRTIVWASSNTAVATVSATGLVTAKAAGSATITATSEGKSATAAITVTVAPVASVTVSPATASLQTGQTVQLTATPKDASGNPLSGRVVTWASSAPAVATVNGSGLVTGVAAGTATITATSEGQSGTAAVTVTAIVTNPGTVANLTVASVTANSVTLSFTEVTDGAGQPAKYDIRWAAGALSWPAATSVAQGTCTVPVVGTAIGAARSCTVLGLASGTAYQFQLVAFRGTLNVDAVFGGLSNVATGTTTSSTAPVASVTVSPASVSLGIGGTQQLTATLRDASGNTLTGRTVTWASSAPLLASVSGSGLVSGLLAGAATITATSEGVSNTAAITITTGGGGSPLNEPAGFRALNDQPWSLMTGSGWNYLRRTSSKDDGIVVDLTAPRSAADVLRIVFTTDMAANTEPSVHWMGLPGVREIYTVWWMKISPNWQSSPAGAGKITFLFTNGAGQVYTGLYHQGGDPTSGWVTGPPYRIGVNTEWAPYGQRVWLPNATTTFINPGQWHRVEVYYRWSTTSGAADGIIRWWVDGALNGNYTNVQYPSGSFTEFQYAPTLQNPPTAELYMYLDHTYVSVP